MKNSAEIYKITFLNKGKVYEVFVKQVYQSDLYGFVEIEDYVFDGNNFIPISYFHYKQKNKILLRAPVEEETEDIL